jgi:hypothetical protein
VPAHSSQAATNIEELLALLADALPELEKPAFERRAAVIPALLGSEAEFSVKTFVAQEVARALDD